MYKSLQCNLKVRGSDSILRLWEMEMGILFFKSRFFVEEGTFTEV